MSATPPDDVRDGGPALDATADVGSLRTRLGRLRTRLAAITVVGGLGRALLVAGALLAGSLAADVLLDLPLGVRRFVRAGLLDRPEGLGALAWTLAIAGSALGLVATARRGLGAAAVFAFLLGGAPGVCLHAIWRWIARPLATRRSDERLAADVERSHRRLNDRLLASLDFEGQLARPTRGESVPFMEATVAEAHREAATIEFASVATARGALLRLGVALACVGAFVGVLTAMPGTSALWWRRSALLEEVAWPRATTLVVVTTGADGRETERDAAIPFAVTLGRSLVVRVRALGRAPQDAEILDRTDRDGPGGRALAHRMRGVVGDPSLFEHEFRDVRGDFSFFVRGGDDRDELPVHRVTVRVPPRVVGVRADLEPPAYLGLPARRVEGGTLSVPEGTRIALSFASDSPLAVAEAFVDDVPAVLATEGDVRTFRLLATKSFRWRARIATADGRENDPALDAYEVAVEPDVPAKPEWVWPRGPVETTPDGRVPLFAATRDDHGIASLALEIEIPGAPVRSTPLVVRGPESPDGANDRAYGADAIRSYVALDVATLLDAEGRPPTAPRRLAARVVARDSRGQESSGPWTSIDVVRADEIERSFSGRRAALKSDLEGIRKELADVRTLTTVPSAADAAGDVERRGLRDVQYRLGRLRGDVDRAARGVIALFNAQVYGRIGSRAPIEKILAILDHRHRETYRVVGSASGAAGGEPSGSSDSSGGAGGAGGAGASGTVDADDVFPYDLYGEISRAKRERRLLDSDVLDRLVTVLDTSVATAAELAPAAEAAAAVAARSGEPAHVEALVAAESRLEEGVASVLSAMSQWQSLAELTLFVRRLIEEQEALRGGIRALDAGDPR